MVWRVFLCLLSLTLPLKAEQIAAAGRLEKNRGSTCSAVLIAPDVVATAAHCTNRDPATGIIFRPGDLRGGRLFPVTRFVRHPLYENKNMPRLWRLRFDLAVAQLEEPVPELRAKPLPLGETAKIGETVYIISWRGDDDRMRQRACPVIEGYDGLVTLGCQVKGGESGAPVIRKTDDGIELVAIISSRTQQLQQPVAQASDVWLRIPPLLKALATP